MKAEDISEAMNNINEDFIESANEIRKPKARKSAWIKWVSAAAAIAIVAFIGAKAFVPSEPEQNDNPLVGGTETEYGSSLPILEYIESSAAAYGFEGYMAYDISELENGNPWNEKMTFDTLPVYRNNSFNEIGIAYPGIGEEAMLKKLGELNGFVEEVSKRNLKNVTVSQTGCIGICQYEPIVEVFAPGKEKVTYIKMTPDKIARVVADHIVNGNPVTEYTVASLKD